MIFRINGFEDVFLWDLGDGIVDIDYFDKRLFYDL
jgi:hypothetical protein